AGAVLEDDGPLNSTSTALFSKKAWRSLFHFLPALNSFPAPACNSIDWGLGGVPCTITPLFLAFTNQFNWSGALHPDINSGLPSNASIESFGYVVHLLEDLGAPAHVRNDSHWCTDFNVLLLAIGSCDPFHLVNNGISPAIPTRPPVISTS